MIDLLVYGAFPYVAMVLFLVVSIQRYRNDPFTFSSLSSQFLESRKLFWGSVPFHLGIIVLFFGHLIGFMFPRQVTLWNSVPLRLFILEATALGAAVLTLIGLVGLIYRRFESPRLRTNTSTADIVVYLIILYMVVTGMWIALGLRWGSAWYTHTAVPYLQSIFMLSPEWERIAALPLAAKLHIAGAWSFICVFPFTRLVHILVAPVPYLWRPIQVVIWNRRRARGAEVSR